MRVNISLLIGQIAGLFAVIALALFWPAGTVAWTAGWTFLIVFFAFVVLLTVWLIKHDPALLQERMRGTVRTEQKRWDKIWAVLANIVFLAWFVIMALDAVRFRWSHVPFGLQVIGALLLLGSFYLFFRTFRENSFLSPVVQVQTEREHTVVSTGPYHYVRHPMYAAAAVLVLGTSLLLGSWLGLLVGAALVLLVARRAVWEEHTLRQELRGYDAYMQQVKYRLIPYIW